MLLFKNTVDLLHVTKSHARLQILQGC